MSFGCGMERRQGKALLAYVAGRELSFEQVLEIKELRRKLFRGKKRDRGATLGDTARFLSMFAEPPFEMKEFPKQGLKVAHVRQIKLKGGKMEDKKASVPSKEWVLMDITCPYCRTPFGIDPVVDGTWVCAYCHTLVHITGGVPVIKDKKNARA